MTQKFNKLVDFTFLWSARAALAVLAVAGMLTLLAPLDAVIAYPITLAVVALLLRETL